MSENSKTKGEKKKPSLTTDFTAQHSRNQRKRRRKSIPSHRCTRMNTDLRKEEITTNIQEIGNEQYGLMTQLEPLNVIPAKAGIHFRIMSYASMLLKITTEIKEKAME